MIQVTLSMEWKSWKSRTKVKLSSLCWGECGGVCGCGWDHDFRNRGKVHLSMCKDFWISAVWCENNLNKLLEWVILSVVHTPNLFSCVKSIFFVNIKLYVCESNSCMIDNLRHIWKIWHLFVISGDSITLVQPVELKQQWKAKKQDQDMEDEVWVSHFRLVTFGNANMPKFSYSTNYDAYKLVSTFYANFAKKRK